MVGGRSGVEEHIQKEGGCLFHFGFLKAAQSDSLGGKKKRRFGWLQMLSLLSEGNAMGQIHGHVAYGSCLVLEPKYLKEETVVTKGPIFSSGGTSSHPTHEKWPRRTGTATSGGAPGCRWHLK